LSREDHAFRHSKTRRSNPEVLIGEKRNREKERSKSNSTSLTRGGRRTVFCHWFNQLLIWLEQKGKNFKKTKKVKKKTFWERSRGESTSTKRTAINRGAAYGAVRKTKKMCNIWSLKRRRVRRGEGVVRGDGKWKKFTE